jgi:hypothetical protein
MKKSRLHAMIPDEIWNWKDMFGHVGGDWVSSVLRGILRREFHLVAHSTRTLAL